MMRILKQSLFDYNNIIPLKSEVQNKKGFFPKNCTWNLGQVKNRMILRFFTLLLITGCAPHYDFADTFLLHLGS